LSAARLALDHDLAAQGRALDAMTEQLAALRRRSNPQDRALLEQLDAARSRLANLVLNLAGSSGKQTSATEQQATITRLEAETQRLEAAVSARSAEFRAQSQPVTIESVQKALARERDTQLRSRPIVHSTLRQRTAESVTASRVMRPIY